MIIKDDEEIKNNGGIFDESGFDGLDSGEDIAEPNSDEREKQRARSVALLWGKNHEPDNEYQALGCTPAPETLPNWVSYNVLMMTTQGGHKLVKVCIPKKEGGMINFALEASQTCKSRVILNNLDSFSE